MPWGRSSGAALRRRAQRRTAIRPLDWLRGLLVLAVGVVLVAAVLDLPREPVGLTAEVLMALEETGVEHPVTAVLLNLRSYDTLAEVGVLLLAALGLQAVARSLDLRPVPHVGPFSTSLRALSVAVWPLAIVAAGYLLWLGTHAPGGAFQSGAVIASAAVLLRVAGFRSIAVLPSGVLRPLLTAGVAAFLAAGVGAMLLGRAFMEYPPEHARTLIVLVETAIAVSIGMTLAAMFIGATPVSVSRGEEPGP